ncbi:hypothetical protein TNCV_4860081 [Trichonephila clavipes]|nr:hypothetical protein TNCV_4860081 [Trichonephila clavipes]
MSAIPRLNMKSSYFLGKQIANDNFQQDWCSRNLPFSAIYRHEDSPRQDKIICSMQTLPRSSTDAQRYRNAQPSQQSYCGVGMVPLRDSLRELLYSPDAPRIAEVVIKTFDGI